MAKLFPCTAPTRAANAGYFRELDVLDRLELDLPDGYEIFHNVDWHSLRQGEDSHGEIDLVIMNRSGELLLMEVKAGQVAFRADGIFKTYGTKTKRVDQQLRVQYSAMLNRLDHAGIKTSIKNCLVLPDCRVLAGEIIVIPRERIFDAEDYEHLGAKVQQLLPLRAPSPGADQVRRFLSNLLTIAPDVSALQRQIVSSSRKLADGLATWVPRIQAPSGMIRIQATAGSGKTQLALRLLSDAAAQQQRALYVCYNRPLSDHISRLAPPQVQVSTFHELCVEHYRRTKGEPDFTSPDMFQNVCQVYKEAMTDSAPRLDLLIIDEGQDFTPDWVECLIGQLKDNGRLYLLEDKDQRLYERDGFDLPDAVHLSCHDNFRSPQIICQTINAFRLASHPIETRSPYPGDAPEFLTSDGSPQAMRQQTTLAVESLLKQGFQISDMVILTGHGASKSALLSQDTLGQHALHRFTGRYNIDGSPIWKEGDLRVESIYRFKGQSDPAVILSEIDFAELNERECRKLFVGLTRAQMAVKIVMTEAAAKVLENCLC
ncbi:ATP-binding domain-containing protein [Propionivibrio sp.]|uniref:nuclease-related domain-containing DEAD/DEAH box helicase n=1 Tax=Propionivibrio sp. TaxID=2212460 RepID=UPI003BF07BD3